MRRTRVLDALQSAAAMDAILVKGWVRTRRDSKGLSFLEINDGSCLKNLQVIVEESSAAYAHLALVSTGAAVEILGSLIPSPGKGQRWEVKATNVTLLGAADPQTYPLQKKGHTDEFLRDIGHLRPRTNKYGALFRIRSESAFAVHQFFRKRGFYYVHTPIITGADCEGAGEMFAVTTLADFRKEHPEAFHDDFFGKKAYLTVSGQLEAELFACALGSVYTFGPTFRAENSNTPRHAAEFWMIEPEVAFADLEDNMDLGEAFVKHLVTHVMEHCAEDLELFARFVDKELMRRLDVIARETYVRLPYTEAVELLQRSGQAFEFPVAYGTDLQTEHERYLTEKHFQKPVIVYNYPKEIKAFYMRVNDDGRTVAAMDLLVPRVGELIGGSQREERLDVLAQRIQDVHLAPEAYEWYLDTRRFGTVPHAGFGLGFERFLMMVTGVTNIRDVIPFPRTPKHLPPEG
ncbi:MAG: asparagine--tRNA ligase [Candidatus Tectomicrobia bacterium]|uniref:Asparagine--tRNA ligase n=1 Tax=Tectimicrobiota bacterium TaxID=2528274 RepID=A0A937W211_UNCTE|nr:asparagine--tRNA ligase [Candidatus Tectomicrobia bacterium]